MKAFKKIEKVFQSFQISIFIKLQDHSRVAFAIAPIKTGGIAIIKHPKAAT
jgi:hypothetical protein